MPWNLERQADPTMIETYARLSQIRKRHRALVDGSMRFLYSSKEALVYIRESKTESVLVCVSRGKDRRVEFPKDAIASPERAENLFGNGNLRVVGSKVRYDAVALDLQIWRLPSAVR